MTACRQVWPHPLSQHFNPFFLHSPSYLQTSRHVKPKSEMSSWWGHDPLFCLVIFSRYTQLLRQALRLGADCEGEETWKGSKEKKMFMVPFNHNPGSFFFALCHQYSSPKIGWVFTSSYGVYLWGSSAHCQKHLVRQWATMILLNGSCSTNYNHTPLSLPTLLSQQRRVSATVSNQDSDCKGQSHLWAPNAC